MNGPKEKFANNIQASPFAGHIMFGLNRSRKLIKAKNIPHRLQHHECQSFLTCSVVLVMVSHVLVPHGHFAAVVTLNADIIRKFIVRVRACADFQRARERLECDNSFFDF